LSLQGNTQLKVIKRASAATLIVIGMLFFFIPNPKEYVYGMIFGASINMLNFRLMSLTLEKSAKMPQSKIIPYIVGNYIIRYLTYAIVLTVAAMADYISLYTVILGFFVVKLVIISDAFYETIKKGKKEKAN